MAKKMLAITLAIIMVLGCMPIAGATEVPTFTDMPNDWSTAALESAVANGLLIGDGGKIMPESPVTRAQMATIVARAFGATEEGDISGYTDVKSTDWYAGSIAKAYKMGVMEGYAGLMDPDKNITREQAFAVLARALKLESASTMNKTFEDSGDISDWAVGEISAMVNAGYIQGSDGKLNPQANIRRNEFAQVMYNLNKQYISAEGEYTEVVDGNLMINVPGVTLKGVTVKGDLIIGDGVGDGEVILEDVIIEGRLLIRGGGENSVIIRGSSSVSQVIVARVDGVVRVHVEGDADVEVIYIDDGSDDVIVEGTVGSIELAADNVTVTATNAKLSEANVSGSNSKIIVDAGSSIGTITTSGANTSVTGPGKVGKVVVEPGGDGAKIETGDTKITVGDGVEDVTAGGGTPVEGGSTATNNADGTDLADDTPVVPAPVAVSAISVTPETLTLTVGDTGTITATVLPAGATNKNVTWTTSDEEVATVADGVVTAVAEGTATITATSNNGKTATCRVAVGLDLVQEATAGNLVGFDLEKVNYDNLTVVQAGVDVTISGTLTKKVEKDEEVTGFGKIEVPDGATSVQYALIAWMVGEEEHVWAIGDATTEFTIEYEGIIYKVDVSGLNWQEAPLVLYGTAVDYTQNTAFQRAIKDLPDGSTVILKNGDFRVAFLTEYRVPANLTVVGEDTATVVEFGIEENVTGLTLKDLKSNVTIYGAAAENITLTNLTIDGCTAPAIHFGNGSGTSIVGATIQNCTLTNSLTGFNGITLNNVSGTTTIKNNAVTNASDIGIALLGTVAGNVTVEGNTISNPGDRALRVNAVQNNATVLFKDNIISDCAVATTVGEGLFKVTSTGAGAAVTFEGNTYDGKAWDPLDIGENASDVVYVIPVEVELPGDTYGEGGGFVDVISELPDGSTIILKPGAFFLNFNEGYRIPRNLTIIGEEGSTVTIAALSDAIDGLTLQNLTFNEGSIVQNGAFDGTMKNLVIDNCSFTTGIIELPSAVMENVTIKNCKFTDAPTTGGKNAISLGNVSGTTYIFNNDIQKALDIGIGIFEKISGTVTIEQNKINNTGDRALRLDIVQDNATVTYKNNTISNCATATADRGLFKLTSSGAGAAVTFEGNKYDDADWDPADIGANESNVVYCIATPDTIVDLLTTAAEGSTIQLTDGAYNLSGLSHINLADNLTIVGDEGVTVTGIRLDGQYVAPCPANLTLKNIAFTGTGVTIANTYAAKNNDINNLTIDNCTFSDNAVFKMNGYCVINSLTIKDSTFGATGDTDKTSILVQGTVSNVLIQDNTITGSVYNGIQITRVAGNLTIDNNTISDTGSRAIRIKTLEEAVLTIKDNTMSNANINGIYDEIIKIDGDITEVTASGNTYDDVEITFTDGIARAQ